MSTNMILLIAVGIFLIVLGIMSIKKANKLKTVCQERTDASICEVRRDHYEKRKNLYIPIYSYIVNGTEYKTEGTGVSSKNKYKVGDSSFVLYNPENPKEALIEGKNDRFAGGIITIIMGIVFIVISTLAD